ADFPELLGNYLRAVQIACRRGQPHPTNQDELFPFVQLLDELHGALLALDAPDLSHSRAECAAHRVVVALHVSPVQPDFALYLQIAMDRQHGAHAGDDRQGQLQYEAHPACLRWLRDARACPVMMAASMWSG